MKLEFPKSTIIEKEERNAFFVYWLRRIFIDDWLMKTVALVITLALWLGVSGLRTPITRPINNVSISTLVSRNLEITNALVPEIDIEITGDKRKVDQVIRRDLAVTLDLTMLQEGESTVQLTPQRISVELPSGVTVTKVTPEKIAVKLERVEEAEVPVRVETEGSPVEGFEVYAKLPAPAKVRIRGPRSFVEGISFVSTDKIDISKKQAPFVVQRVPLSISDPKITLIDDVTANVTIQIGRKRIERLYVVQYNTETRSGNANVLLYGPDDVMERLSSENLIIVESRTEEGQSRLDLVLPADVKDKVVVRSVKYRE